MLSKVVCKKCISLSGDEAELWNVTEWKGDHFDGDDDDAWDAGLVCCPEVLTDEYTQRTGNYVDDVVTLTEKIPEWCPNRFKHLVAAGMSDAK